MNYRLQDFIRLIIPGLYVCTIFLFCELVIKKDVFNINLIKDLSSIFILLIPFVGFVIGYFIECFMALAEHRAYKWNLPRPSRRLIKGATSYPIANLNKITTKFHVTPDQVTNKLANEICQEAKQSIDRGKVEDFRNNSILARNLLGAQLIVTIYVFCYLNEFCNTTITIILIIILFVFGRYWWHHNCVYIKYVLAEYAKIL